MMKILCIGDSNTYGHDPRSYLGSRYPKEVRWTGLLTNREVVNCGMNGMTMPRNISVFVDLVEKNEPDLIIVMIGTNDLLEGAGADQICSQMELFLDSIREMGKPILLISPPYLKQGEWVQDEKLIEESQKLGELYRKLAREKNILFADAGEWEIEMTFDGVHFSPAGHKQFAKKAAEILEQL